MKKIVVDIEKIRELAERGMTQSEIGEILGCGKHVIRSRCKKHNIKTIGLEKKMEKERQSRIGETNTNKYGSKIIIVEYRSYKDITVEFENGYRVKTSYGSFLKGSPRSVYDRTVCGVGYLGEGDYQWGIDGVESEHYAIWTSMIFRCYSEKKLKRNSAYKDVTVCEEWLNFNVFSKWYDENYYEIKGEKMHLEKDILIKGNRCYSPDACVFAPSDINAIFNKMEGKRGDCPIGVNYDNTRLCYVAQYDSKHLGYYKDPITGFYAYKKAKESYIKQVADQYKDKIPQKLYDAMYRYEVEITD